ncbi:MAG: EVE domain-containing protein [Bacteroidia bacterium]|jgi:predicted RNA-binding protein with PUA-like domain|nr:EVE domain-containing protein [Bacteroidia bacterium]MDG2042161.1 EVE domain-containing protein [Bacteroidia bacterium]|tara:strand:- start:5621 stop:6034 length:414 start_codon:yes stop_codon:yes gene_type:complete
MNYWLIKSEPYKYSWDQMVKDGSTYWDGVRSYPARVHLRAMKDGDICLFYHSNEGKEIVGITRVIKEAYQDPTTEDEKWVAVDVEVIKPLNKSVTLAQIKSNDTLANMALVKQARLSVGPVKEFEFEEIIKLSDTVF